MAEKSRQKNFLKICEKCHSKCCYQARPPLTKSRAKKIDCFLKETKGDAFLLHVGRYSHPEELADGYCILFDRVSGLCKAHPVKPETCVAGPITFDINRKDGKIEWYLKNEKICALAGDMARNDPSLSKHLEVAKREILRLVNGLERTEIQAILEIDEEDTYKVGEDPLPERVLRKLRILVE